MRFITLPGPALLNAIYFDGVSRNYYGVNEYTTADSTPTLVDTGMGYYSICYPT